MRKRYHVSKSSTKENSGRGEEIDSGTAREREREEERERTNVSGLR